jgi:hypothetical protein
MNGEKPNGMPRRLLNAGFIVGLIISFICLLACFAYLFRFLAQSGGNLETLLEQNRQTPPHTLIFAINGKMIGARLALLSCGISAGLAFGFLGFSLFLLGIQGNVNATVSGKDLAQAEFANLSPGLFVLLCSTALIGVCVTRSMPFTFDATTKAALDWPTNVSSTGRSMPSISPLLGNTNPP